MITTSKPWLVAALLSTTAIIVLNSLPASAARVPSFVGADKIAHATLYAAAAFSWRSVYAGGGRRVTWWVVLGLAVLGALDETRQLWVPGRMADVGDWLADLSGILLAVAVWHGVARRGRRT